MTVAGGRAGSGINVGRIAGVGPGMGGSGNVNGSLESLSEDGDVHKVAPVLEAMPVILLVDLSLEGDVNVLGQDALKRTWSLISRSKTAE
jgi:hypothetical protein